MLFPESGLRIGFCRQPADMRKSFNGLSAVVKHHLKENLLSGELFVFVNKRKTLMRILYVEQSDYCIWFKHLEAGVFQPPAGNGDKIQLNYTELTLILILDVIDMCQTPGQVMLRPMVTTWERHSRKMLCKIKHSRL